MEFASKFVYIPGENPGVAAAPKAPTDTAPPLATVPEDFEEETDSEQPKPKPPGVKLLLPAETPRQNGTPEAPQFKRTLSVKALLNETKDVVDWHGVGIQLDVTPANLNRIHAEHATEERRKAKMYEFWLANDPDASWEKLSVSLQNVAGHYCLGQTIRKEYVDPPDEPKRKVQFDELLTTDRPAPEIDTNVLAIKFKILGEPKPLHTGDAVFCSNDKCGAVLNSYSVIAEEEASDKIWACEFCGTENSVDVVHEEIPLKSDIQYVITPGPAQNGARGGAYYEEPTGKNALVVFCVDTSGSMGVTSEVKGRFELRGHDRLTQLHRQYSEGQIQFMPGQRRDVTYVSRMQSVQGAIDHQFSTLAKTSPSQKVALVTFNNEVTIAGDGKLGEVVVSGDRLSSYDELVKLGEELATPSAISKNREYLSKTVMDIEESGQTALGPALLLSIVLAGKAPGSKVIICTDGLANAGIGSLDNITTHEKLQIAEEYYSKLGVLARDKSVSVSVLTIKGTETRLLELGRVADISKGKVNVVDPARVKEEFTSILATPVVATEVKAKVVLHYDLCIRGSEDSLIKIPVGNVTTSTELTYEFEPRKKPSKKLAAKGLLSATQDGASIAAAAAASVLVPSPPPVKVAGKPYLPFQLQIEFTAPDKSRYLRVVTNTKPFTSDLDQAEMNMHMPVMGLHNSRMNCAKISYRPEESRQYLQQSMGFFTRQRERGVLGSETVLGRLEQRQAQRPIAMREKLRRTLTKRKSAENMYPDYVSADITSGINESWDTLQAKVHAQPKPEMSGLLATTAGSAPNPKPPGLLESSTPASSTVEGEQTDTTTLTVCSDGAAAAADSDLEPADTEEDKTLTGSEGSGGEEQKSWFRKLWSGTSS